MDKNWTKVSTPDDEDGIPRLPTRAEELAYLDELERDLRHQSHEQSSFPPDPSRKFHRDAYAYNRKIDGEKTRKMTMLAVLFTPVSFWLADKSCAKSSMLGIPYRSYPMQHRIRFWTIFATWDFLLTWVTFYGTLDESIRERALWPLSTSSPRKL